MDPMNPPSIGRPEEVWAYLVVSDPGQAHTLPDQERWARDYAFSNGWHLTEIYRGVESGKAGTRGLCDGMVDAIEALPKGRRPQRILMIRLDRMGRGTGLSPFLAFARLCTMGITIETRQDGAIRVEKTQDSLLPLMRFYVGGFENDVRRDKLRATYAKKRVKRAADATTAIGTTAPYGLQIVDGRYVLKEPEARAVRQAFQMAREYGAHRIAKFLKTNAPPWTLKGGRQKVQTWHTDRVRKMLSNDHYRNTLVDEEAWLLAQVRKGEFKRPTIKNHYALGGALRCVCGTSLRGHPGPGVNRKTSYRYYQCPNYSAHTGKMKHHRSDVMESQFSTLLSRLRADEQLLEHFVSASTGGPNGAAVIVSTRVIVLRETASKYIRSL
jgi:DNA invertase Pin-like site-specific DNA recombinase